jgi:hypothetical protein
MIEKRFDDDWFIGYRHNLLETAPYAREERRPHAVHTILHGARLGGEVDARIDEELRRLPFRHASAIRGHMQFYRAALTATGLLPADMIVNVAVQLEWFWYTTAFSAFYRDHLAHVMKVAAVGLALLQEKDGPLADGSTPFIDVVARGMASCSIGSPAIRAAARRCGIAQETLNDPAFWRAAVLDAVRIAGLLHDMAHPAVIASKMSRIAAPVRPLAPFEPTEEELCGHAVSVFGHRLLATPFNRGELPDSKGLAKADAEACADVFLQSHSLRAGYAIIRLADDADRVFQLNHFDAFVLEWAALAVSLHDYDKLFALPPTRPETRRLYRWLNDDVRNVDAVRPCFERDPVSYILALADRIQEFGRVLGPMDSQAFESEKLEAFVRYPCRAVTLRVDRRVRDEATILIELGADDGTCFGAADYDYQRIKEYKEKEATWIFGDGGWLDSRGIFAHIAVEVVRAKPSAPSAVEGALAGAGAGAEPVKLFYSFADTDEQLREALERHLSTLKWQGVLADWHHRKISAGEGWKSEADSHMEAADIVLLLISADFIASQYAAGFELEKALLMHRSGAARVIPVLVRSVDMSYGPLSELRALPSDGKPVTSWANQDEAWTDVVQGIRQVVEDIRASKRPAPGSTRAPGPGSTRAPAPASTRFRR